VVVQQELQMLLLLVEIQVDLVVGKQLEFLEAVAMVLLVKEILVVIVLQHMLQETVLLLVVVAQVVLVVMDRLQVIRHQDNLDLVVLV
tara:strand:- start:1314 stop:1577 length:264 start_codon:yes stop_codon:yes gene_type:complete